MSSFNSFQSFFGNQSVVSEEHSSDNIAVNDADIDRAMRGDGNSLIDVGNGRQVAAWDASEYGISREEVQRQLAAAETPEGRQQIMDDLKLRAIDRADLAEIDGKIAVAVAGEAAWHRLGVNVSQAMSSEEAIAFGSLDYEVLKIPVSYSCNGSSLAVPGVYGVGRIGQDGQVHPFSGVHVGSGYSLFQNRESFSFLDNVMGESGAKFDAVGATSGGRKVFLSMMFPNVAEPVKGDEIRHYGLLTNAHDGTESLTFFSTDVRTVCSNTRRQAIRGRKGGFSIPHTRNMRTQVARAEQAIAQSQKAFQNFGEMAELMAKASVQVEEFSQLVCDRLANATTFKQMFLTADQRRGGLDEFMAGIVDEVVREAKAKEFNRRLANSQTFSREVLEVAAKPTNLAEGTLWGAFNAVTEYANHSVRYIGTDSKKNERRMYDLMTGRASIINDAATAVATEMLSA